ncbi:MAG TPA: hypothetical protein VF047_09685 [Nitrososphaeraceae archaeon]
MKKLLLFMLYSMILKTPRKGNQQQSPFVGTSMAFTSPEDLMKNLPKMFSGGGGVDVGNSPTFKLSIREYTSQA